MPRLLSKERWEAKGLLERICLTRASMGFNRILRPLTSIGAGFLYFIASNILNALGLPCIKFTNLLTLDHGWAELAISTALVMSIYTLVGQVTQEVFAWAFEPSLELFAMIHADVERDG